VSTETRPRDTVHPSGVEAVLATARQLERQLLAGERTAAGADPWFTTRFEAFLDELRVEVATEAHAFDVPVRPSAPERARAVERLPVAVVAPVAPPGCDAPVAPTETPSAAMVEPWVPDPPSVGTVAGAEPGDDLERSFWNDGAKTWRDRIPKKPKVKKLSTATFLQGGAVLVAATAALLRLG
jgi:hypothetical protein